MKLVVATHNAGKLVEIKELLHELPLLVQNKVALLVQSAGELGIDEPEETGATFAANSSLKAEHSAQFVHDAYVLADDSGLAVDILGGNPGIYSARWGGATKDFGLAAKRIHDEIVALGANPEGQAAQFICNLALAKHGKSTICFEGIVHGRLTFPPRGELGFGYDPIFVANDYAKGCELTFAEMNPAEKHAISHRAQAFEKFMQHFEKIINIS